MPRNPRPEVIDVNQARAEAYQSHFEYRQFARNYARSADVLKMLQYLPRPTLNVFGAAALSGKSFAAYPTTASEVGGYYEVAAHCDLAADQLFWWYWVEDGWREFERLWDELPEVVHIPLCTTSKVVHICTQGKHVYPSQKVGR